jgi:hypothetical protein
MRDFDEFCQRTDWADLRQQKATLVAVQSMLTGRLDDPKILKRIQERVDTDFEGLLNFLDHLQDMAEEAYGYDVYGKGGK